MNPSIRSRVLLVAMAFIGLWAALGLWAFTSEDNAEGARNRASQEDHDGHGHEGAKNVSDAATGNRPPPDRPMIETLPIFDTSDPRRVIGFSENVFVGRVREKVSEVPLKNSAPDNEGEPQVQFRVEAGALIKSGGPRPLSEGDAAVVDQMGGIEEKTGKPYVVYTITGGDHFSDEILEPGKEYLFATRFDPARGFHTIVAQPHGNVLLSGNNEAEAVLELYRRSAEDQIDPAKTATP